MIRLYRQYFARWSEPEDLWVYDPRDYDDPHRKSATVRLQLGQLIGSVMSPASAPWECLIGGCAANYFSELHLGCRLRLKKAEREQMARYLANLAEYPFANDLKLDWWEVINNPGDVPFFPGCRHLLLHPILTPQGVDVFEDEEGRIRLLYVVPITTHEHHLIVVHGREKLVDYFAENEIDTLTDRNDVRT